MEVFHLYEHYFNRFAIKSTSFSIIRLGTFRRASIEDLRVKGWKLFRKVGHRVPHHFVQVLVFYFLRPSFSKIVTFVSKWHPNWKNYIFYTRVIIFAVHVLCTKTTHQPHNPIKHRVKYLYKSNTEKNVYTTIFYLPWDTFLDTHIISFDDIFSLAVALLAMKWTQ